MERDVITVVGAAIERDDGRILLCRRAPGEREAGYWEFPGGKVHAGESERDCLIRELREELGINVRVEGYLAGNTHRYGERLIRLHVYRCIWLDGEIVLTVHDAIDWVRPERLNDYKLAPADVPIAMALRAARCDALRDGIAVAEKSRGSE